MRKSYLILGLLALLGSCTPKRLSQSALQQYVADESNGLMKSEQVKGLEVKIAYRPTDLLIAQEVGDRTPSVVELAQLEKRYGEAQYFILSFSRDNHEVLNPQEFGQYSELVQTLSFRMGQYVQLVSSRQDTLELSDFAFERTYGMAGSNSLLLAFSTKQLQLDWDWLQVNLSELGLGVGDLRFRFERKDLENVPRLEWSKVASSQ